MWLRVAKAEKLFDSRTELLDGSLIVIRIWRVPQAVPPSGHWLKYSLFSGRPGQRIVLFDNERGTGDHKHIEDVESGYDFTTIEQLVVDFLAAVRAFQTKGSE